MIPRYLESRRVAWEGGILLRGEGERTGRDGKEITTRRRYECTLKYHPSSPENSANMSWTVEEPLDLSASPYHITLDQPYR